MAMHHANTEEGSSQIKKNVNEWKYPKIPVDQVYKKKVLGISPSYAIKDFEHTITVNSNCKNVHSGLLSSNFLQGFIKKKHRFVHLGLVQIAIKPLTRDGLGAPIVVSLRDDRHLDFHNSLLAHVKVDTSRGPLYFNCFPSFSVSLDDDASLFKVLTLYIETGGIPLALTYRLVCKAMVDLSPEGLKEPVLGETTYFQPAVGTQDTTKWDEIELQAHESWTCEHEPKPHDRTLKKGSSISTKFANEQGGSCQIRTILDGWKYPKVPVKQVYSSTVHMGSERSLWSKAKKMLHISPSNPIIKDYEKTITLKSNNQINVSLDLLKGLSKIENETLHLGLFQIAVKPLSYGEGLGGPIIVCLRDTRMIHFKDSVRALVEADASEGPFYFNYCPGHYIRSEDLEETFKLNVMSGVPLELTYRLVCYVTNGPFSDYRKSIFRKGVEGETTCYHPITGTESTTIWDEVQVPDSWS